MKILYQTCEISLNKVPDIYKIKKHICELFYFDPKAYFDTSIQGH